MLTNGWIPIMCSYGFTFKSLQKIPPETIQYILSTNSQGDAQKLKLATKSLGFYIPSFRLVIVAVNIRINRSNPEIFTCLSLR